MSKIKRICIDCGHGYNTPGKRTSDDGTREWYLNQRIGTLLETMLVSSGYEVLRADDVTGRTDVPLSKRVKLSNDNKCDLYISIHHNAGLNGRHGGGTTIYWYSSNRERPIQAKALYDSIIRETGLVGNRFYKTKNHPYYVLKNTKAPAFLIENGFMDSPDDIPIIKSNKHAESTAIGIYNFILNLG